MKNMSWPVIWLIVIILLPIGYFIGQARLHHEAPGTNAGTVATAQPLH